MEHRKTHALAGPDWLFWSIVILWFVSGALMVLSNPFALMFLALLLRENPDRVGSVARRLVSRKICSGVSSESDDRISSLTFWALFMTSPLVTWIGFATGKSPTSEMFITAIIGFIVVLAMLLFSHCFYGRRKSGI